MIAQIDIDYRTIGFHQQNFRYIIIIILYIYILFAQGSTATHSMQVPPSCFHAKDNTHTDTPYNMSYIDRCMHFNPACMCTYTIYTHACTCVHII